MKETKEYSEAFELAQENSFQDVAKILHCSYRSLYEILAKDLKKGLRDGFKVDLAWIFGVTKDVITRYLDVEKNLLKNQAFKENLIIAACRLVHNYEENIHQLKNEFHNTFENNFV